MAGIWVLLGGWDGQRGATRSRSQPAKVGSSMSPAARPNTAFGGLGLGCRQPVAVQAQEQTDGQEGGALVAIDERVVLGQAEGIAGGQIGEVRFAIGSEVGGSRHRRFEQAFVADA
jgi:hypothetical protein